MLSHRNTMDSNMEHRDSRSVKIHSAVFGSCLIQVSHVLDHNGRSTSEWVSFKLPTEKSKSPEGYPYPEAV